MAKAATAEKTESAPKERDYDEITYVPGREDPPFTIVNGVEFAANKPVKVPRTKTVQNLLTQTRENEDGQVLSRGVERRIPMAVQLEGNPFFSINGVQPAASKTPKRPLPTSNVQYRSYAINWIAGSDDATAMDERWAAEQNLREKCSVDENDLAFLTPFFDARHSECRGGKTIAVNMDKRPINE